MRRISLLAFIIMIHSGYGVFSMSSGDFNKEIEMVSQEQYKEHLVTLNQMGATEAAVNFENTYRRPSPGKSLTFFPMRLKPKPFMKPKTKVAINQSPVPNSPNPPVQPKPTSMNAIDLYREQVM